MKHYYATHFEKFPKKLETLHFWKDHFKRVYPKSIPISSFFTKIRFSFIQTSKVSVFFDDRLRIVVRCSIWAKIELEIWNQRYLKPWNRYTWWYFIIFSNFQLPLPLPYTYLLNTQYSKTKINVRFEISVINILEIDIHDDILSLFPISSCTPPPHFRNMQYSIYSFIPRQK